MKSDPLMLLKFDLLKAWSAETSNDPDAWTKENPAWGQCAVTALVVQDAWGGDLLKTVAHLPDGRDISHYFNRLPNGNVVDLTREQFPDGTTYGASEVKERSYVTSYEATVRRYRKLVEILSSYYC